MDRNYKGIIWTNHALQRLKQRGLSQADAYATWNNPDESRYAQSKGGWVYYKNLGNRKIEVVAKQNDRKQWLIISVWAKGISDHHHKYSKHKSHKKQSLLTRFLKKLLNIK